MDRSLPADYRTILKAVKERIHAAQYTALRTVNKALVELYRDIGRTIVERQGNEAAGRAIVEQLSMEIIDTFPGIRGFRPRNIWNRRRLHLHCADCEKLQQLVAEIGWGHNIAILTKCNNDLEREYYLRMTRKFGWSRNVLIHQIENQTYEKTLLNQTSFDQTLPEPVRGRAKLAVKDEYLFDFLELGNKHDERQLEQALIARMEDFLREMGGLFAFVGSQYRLEVGEKEFFIDILLYHRRLESLVAVELKVGEFKPEYVGKMQFYLAALDDRVRMAGENPSIGIILCKSRDKTIVEYALRRTSTPIGVARYRMVRQVPEELQRQLPTPEQITRLLGEID